MALIRATCSTVTAPTPPQDLPTLLLGLQDAQPAARREAARALAQLPNTSQWLVGRLNVENESSVIEGLMTALAQQADEVAVEALLDCLRSEDAALRNDAIEALKTAGRHQPQLIQQTLGDSDSDVRILAISILESLKHPDVELWLIELVEQDPHLNVCACAVDLLCEVGTERARAALEQCRERFADEDYLVFAIELALSRLRGADNQ
jgi:HEAT repeat protein